MERRSLRDVCRVKRSFNFYVVLLLSILVLCMSVSCTKKRPVALREEQQRDLVSVDFIKKNDSFKIKLSPKIKDLKSINDISYSTIDLNSVPSFLKIAFKNVVVENIEGKTELEINLELREDNKLVVYKIVSSGDYDKLSVFEQTASERSGLLSYKIPLFYFKDVSFIKPYVHKDDKGNETISYDLQNVKLSQAEYLKINFDSDKPIIIKNFFEETSVIAKKKEQFLDKKVTVTLTSEDKCISNQNVVRCGVQSYAGEDYLSFLFEKLEMSLGGKYSSTIDVVLGVEKLGEKQFLIVKRYIDPTQKNAILSNEKARLMNDKNGIYYIVVKHPASLMRIEKDLDDNRMFSFKVKDIPDYKDGMYLVVKPDVAENFYYSVDKSNKDQIYSGDIREYTVSAVASCRGENLVKAKEGEQEDRCRVALSANENDGVPDAILKIFSDLYLAKKYLGITDREVEKKMSFFIRFKNDYVSVLRILDQSADEKNLIPSELKTSMITDGPQSLVELVRIGATYYKNKNVVNEQGQAIDSFYTEQTTMANADFVNIQDETTRKPSQFIARDPYLLEKSKINEKDYFLYVPSVHNVPSQGVAMLRGFIQGNAEVVKFRFTEKSLDVYHLEFVNVGEAQKIDYSNPRDIDLKNDHLIISIPIKHIDFSNDIDAFGNMGNVEQESTKLTWDKRRYFIPYYKNMAIWNFNDPGHNAGISDKCYNRISTELRHINISGGKQNPQNGQYDIVADGMDIEIKSNYNANISEYCLGLSDGDTYFDVENKFSSNTFSIDLFYSFRKLSRITSSDYEPVDYPEYDQKKFGFFASKYTIYNKYLDDERRDDKFYLKRWNPKKGLLRFSLSPSFYEKGNEIFKEATLESIQIINKGLLDAETGLQVQIDENRKNSYPGKLDENTIVLMDDQYGAATLLGYCPAVGNPLTGEIVQSHIVMYGSTMKKIVRSTYEQILYYASKKDRNFVPSEVAPAVNNANDNIGDGPSLSEEDKGYINYDYFKNKKDIEDFLKQEKSVKKEDLLSYLGMDIKRNSYSISILRDFEKNIDKDIFNKIKKNDQNFNTQQFLKEYQELDSKVSDHIYTVNELELGALLGDPLKIFDSKKELFSSRIINGKEVLFLKNWDDLSELSREYISEVIIKHLYISTFVHEFGHGLGLRHNFISKFDKDNFFDEKSEMQKFAGKKDGYFAPYSSVMDYGVTYFDELMTYGKYDIAALRFGYARKIELINQQAVKEGNKANEIKIIPLKKTIRDFVYGDLNSEGYKDFKLKKYEYCTDEDTDNNPLFCRRHIKGGNLSEVLDFIKKRYEYKVKFSSRRIGRTRFTNGYGDQAKYFSFIMEAMKGIKEIAWFASSKELVNMVICKDPNRTDIYDFICRQYNEIDDKKIIGDVGRFFANELIMPDHTCLVKKFKPEELKKDSASNYLEQFKGRIDDKMLKENDIEKNKLYDLFLDYIALEKKDASFDFPQTCMDSRIALVLDLKKNEVSLIDEKAKKDIEKVLGKDKNILSDNESTSKISGHKVVGEYGRVMADFLLPRTEGFNDVDVAVRGAWVNKLLAAYLVSFPVTASKLSFPYKALSEYFLSNEVFNTIRVDEFFRNLLEGRPLERSTIWLEGGDRPGLETNFNIDPSIVYYPTRGPVSDIFNLRSDKIDIYKEIVKIADDTYRSFASYDENKVLRQKWVELEYRYTDRDDSKLIPIELNKAISHKYQDGITYYAHDENKYAKNIIENLNWIRAKENIGTNLIQGEFSVEGLESLQKDRLIWALKKKNELLKDVALESEFERELCTGILGASSAINLGDLWERIVYQKNPELLNRLDDYLKDVISGNMKEANIKRENLRYQWVSMESFLPEDIKNCTLVDMNSIKKIIVMQKIMMAPLKESLSLGEYSLAMDFGGLRPHSTFLGKEFLESYYKIRTENGKGEFEKFNSNSDLKNADPKKFYEEIDEKGAYTALTFAMIGILNNVRNDLTSLKKDEFVPVVKMIDGILAEDQKIEDVWTKVGTHEYSIYRRYLDVTALLSEAEVAKTDLGAFMKAKPYFATEKINADFNDEKEFVRLARNQLIIKREKISQTILNFFQSHNDLLKDKKQFEEIEEFRKQIIASHNRSINEDRKIEVSKRIEYAMSNVALTSRSLIARMVEELIVHDLETFKKLVQEEYALSKKVNLKGKSLELRKHLKSILKIVEAKEFFKSDLVTSFAIYLSSIPHSEMRRDIAFINDYETLKERSLGSLLKNSGNGLVKEDFKIFARNFHNYDAVFENIWGYENIHSRIKYLVPVQ